MNTMVDQQTVTIYKVRNHDGDFEVGGYHYSLVDEGGWVIKQGTTKYALPDGYRLGKDRCGDPAIIDSRGDVCDLVQVMGRPHVISALADVTLKQPD